ncbi:SOS response-associated peptidase family protein [Sphingobacterium sp. DR205]|uniref:SOS response-associated peptidase n=1 Tax=Sphingobacterium sp. DR205 TaxID=2713573 RepID=UPI0013E4620F|nr:SOS response-associated peptidase family protein [Sphingobacterium sp. DR205]QIH34516.1 SOS response-associated peptidase [Sphingobacterium sp. DR205]
MCYYNGQRVSRDEFIRLMDLEKAVMNYDFLDQEIHEGFNYGNIAVLKPTADKCNFDIVQMEWGFIPFYVKNREDVKKMRFGYKDGKGKWHPAYTTLNAKGEELLLKDENTGREKMFRKAALERRCLILSSEFYEWRHIFRLNKRTGEPLKTADKFPYHIGLKNKEYFFIAAIWQNWTDQDTGETVDTVALVTTEANPLMRQIHNSKNRMPTMLPDELAWEWMMEDLSEERITELATYQISASEMEAYTIEKDFKTTGTPTKAFVYTEVPELTYEV